MSLDRASLAPRPPAPASAARTWARAVCVFAGALALVWAPLRRDAGEPMHRYERDFASGVCIVETWAVGADGPQRIDRWDLLASAEPELRSNLRLIRAHESRIHADALCAAIQDGSPHQDVHVVSRCRAGNQLKPVAAGDQDVCREHRDASHVGRDLSDEGPR